MRDWKQFIQAVNLSNFSSKLPLSGVKRLGPCLTEVFAKSLAIEEFPSCRSAVKVSLAVPMFRFQISKDRVSMHRSACYPVIKVSRLWSSVKRMEHKSCIQMGCAVGFQYYSRSSGAAYVSCQRLLSTETLRLRARTSRAMVFKGIITDILSGASFIYMTYALCFYLVGALRFALLCSVPLSYFATAGNTSSQTHNCILNLWSLYASTAPSSRPTFPWRRLFELPSRPSCFLYPKISSSHFLWLMA